jgi:hypothetical protein
VVVYFGGAEHDFLHDCEDLSVGPTKVLYREIGVCFDRLEELLRYPSSLLKNS